MSMLVLLSVAIFVQAQTDESKSDKMAQKRVDRLTEQLDLNAAQQEKIKALVLKQQEERKAQGKKMRELKPEERTELIEKRKAARAAFDKEMKEILNEEQLVIYEKQKAEHKGKLVKHKRKGKKGRKGKNANVSTEERVLERTNHLSEQLGLSKEQKMQVYELALAQAKAVEMDKRRRDLTTEEKAELKERRKVAQKTFEEGIIKLLTAEQLTLFEQKKAQRMEKRKSKKKEKKN